MLDRLRMPKHVAVIMDGNGRWAKARGLPRTQGHLEGVKRVDDIIEMASKLGLQAITLYTFSTENWSRPEQEVSMLMKTIVSVLEKRLSKLCQNNIQFRYSGRREGAPVSVLQALDNVMEKTAQNTGLIFNIAFNYGGRQEILDAVRSMAHDVKAGVLDPEDIDEELMGARLYTAGLPDPELLIRTSGELRISNFLLWQLSYAEFYFTDKFWPEFMAEDFEQAIMDYQKRDRRFGNIDSQGEKS